MAIDEKRFAPAPSDDIGLDAREQIANRDRREQLRRHSVAIRAALASMGDIRGDDRDQHSSLIHMLRHESDCTMLELVDFDESLRGLSMWRECARPKETLEEARQRIGIERRVVTPHSLARKAHPDRDCSEMSSTTTKDRAGDIQRRHKKRLRGEIEELTTRLEQLEREPRQGAMSGGVQRFGIETFRKKIDWLMEQLARFPNA